jgi:hypothetical protein
LPFRPLPCRTVECVLQNFDFAVGPNQTAGSHVKWVCIRAGHKYNVTLDCHRGQVGAKDVRSIIGQMGISAKEFWREVDRC